MCSCRPGTSLTVREQRARLGGMCSASASPHNVKNIQVVRKALGCQASYQRSNRWTTAFSQPPLASSTCLCLDAVSGASCGSSRTNGLDSFYNFFHQPNFLA